MAMFLKLCSPKAIQRLFSTSQIVQNHKKCKLLIVGGGAGGSAEAAKFSSALGRNKVIVLEPSDKHYYQPMFTMIGGGMKELSDSWRPMKNCISGLAEWVQDAAVHFDMRNNMVTTTKGTEIEFEFLIVATGLQLNYSQIPGLVESLTIPNGKVCSNYSPAYVNRTYKAFQQFKKGNAIFTFPNSPVKCPGAPQKVMYIFEHYTRKQKNRQHADIFYNTALPVIFGVKHYADALTKVCKKRNIHVNTRTNLVEVNVDKNQAIFENLDNSQERKTLDFELLHVTPPMSTPNCLKECKDLTNEAGFVEVNKDTLQHIKYKNVFAIGDCSSSPNSKTAASVAAQSYVVYKNLNAVMNGKVPDSVYDGYASCPLVTGYDSCILAEFDYNLKPLETFPFPQSKERLSMFFMKKYLMPPLYWHLLLKGMWNGPETTRRILSLFKPLWSRKN
jgi:NADPH-dependent 2,4-dienoyl-CoA reductase/sulfur reductase-like enzyme